jgi:hypothetical protein
VFRTSGGHIYKILNSDNVFFTSHSITRFEERITSKILETIKYVHKKRLGTIATSLDLLNYIFMDAIENGAEYAIGIGPDKCVYLNVKIGIIVFNRFNNVFVAKTFLTPEMVPIKELKWLSTDFDKVTSKDSFDKLLDNYYPISEPCFHSKLFNI